MTRKARSTQPVERTRNRILLLLKEEGPSDSISLAKRLRLSAMGVRQHLYALVEENLVSSTTEPRRIGRPVKVWRLTPAADQFFPDTHPKLTIDLMDAIQRCFGEVGFERVLKSRKHKQLADLRAQLPPEATLEDRLDFLVERRRKEGFLAEVRTDEEAAYLLIENHCPVHAAAVACEALCDMELSLLRSILGPNASVERVEHILDGSRRCVYRVAATGGPGTGASNH
jgi:predicted ArsR family transcriptional regulator